MSSIYDRAMNQNGRISSKRKDTKVKNLKGTYRELENINGNMTVGTLEKRLDVTSLSAAIKKLRKKGY
jgi:hypothetical protein